MKIKTLTRRLPTKADWNAVFSSFSRREWYAFFFFVALFIAGTLTLLSSLSHSLSVSVPLSGGSYTEGIVGTPRYINPVIALTDADRDLAALVFSGLTRKDENGTILPDLASSWEISEDGLTYTFVLDSNARFSDGAPVTSKDIVFTIKAIQDATLKSPLRAKWEGVSVTTPDDQTVVFTLKQPFVGFLQNTSIGILPSHLWGEVSYEEFPFSDLNIYPIGSGLYEVAKVEKKTGGVPVAYILHANSRAIPHAPYIKKITIRFYPNEDARLKALKDGSVDAVASVAPEDASLLAARGLTVVEASLPRVFGLYFNHNKAAFLGDIAVVGAIEKALDKEAIVNEVLLGYGTPIAGPLPPGVLPEVTHPEVTPQDLEGAAAALDKAGWTLGDNDTRQKKNGKTTTTLSFSIATADTPELKATAEYIRDTLAQIGVAVEVKVFDIGTLNQSIIRERDYDALLFGQIIADESDLFAFWHSSQRNSPGLNISGYTNKDVDAVLEKNAQEKNADTRMTRYETLIKNITHDKPAIFLFSPSFLYVERNTPKNISLPLMATPSERFTTIGTWFKKEQKVWPIFNRNTDK